MTRGRLPLVLAVLALSPPAPAADDPGAVLRQEISLLDQMDQSVFEARRAEAAVKAAEAARVETESRLKAAGDALVRARQDAGEAARRFAATLRLARAGASWTAASSMLLGGDDLDLARRQNLLSHLAGRQGREVSALVDALSAAEVAEFRAGIERANAHATAVAEQAAREDLQARMGERRELLAKVERNREYAVRRAKELGESERALVREIDSRLRERAAPVAFEKRKGRVRWPLADARVEVPFGDVVHPVFKTVTPHPGLTLAYSAPSRNVRAVAFGRVAWIGHMRGFGTTVVVDHASGYYTVYAGLAEVPVAEGTVVREGTLLGSVLADPGGGPARLYFEIRRGGEALDPSRFLAREQEP